MAKMLEENADEESFSIMQKPDSGYFVTGWTYSTDGQVKGNHGSYDTWLLNLGISGDLVWQVCFGGTAEDYGNVFERIADGGYLIGERRILMISRYRGITEVMITGWQN